MCRRANWIRSSLFVVTHITQDHSSSVLQMRSDTNSCSTHEWVLLLSLIAYKWSSLLTKLEYVHFLLTYVDALGSLYILCFTYILHNYMFTFLIMCFKFLVSFLVNKEL